MKISDDQIGKVIEYLARGGGDAAPSASAGSISLDPRLVDQIREHLQDMPDVREERVRHLKASLSSYYVPPEEIARKIIGRAIGDQLR